MTSTLVIPKKKKKYSKSKNLFHSRQREQNLSFARRRPSGQILGASKTRRTEKTGKIDIKEEGF